MMFQAPINVTHHLGRIPRAVFHCLSEVESNAIQSVNPLCITGIPLEFH